MALDRLFGIFKVGDTGPNPMDIKDKMLICYIDESEWNKPIEEIGVVRSY